jgi:hypothetical protein
MPAAFQGPGSSWSLNQERLQLHIGIVTLAQELTSLDSISDPDLTFISEPVLPTTLQVGLDGGALFDGGGIGRLAPASFTLPANSDTYIDALVSGLGGVHDFPATTLIFQPSGTYANSSMSVSSTLVATGAIDIRSGLALQTSYTGFFTASAGGWGPGIVDRAGTGYAIRTTNGAGALFRTVNGIATGVALLELPTNTTNLTGAHTFGLTIAAQGANAYLLQITIDGSLPIQYSDPVATMSPIVFPAFISDGGTVFLRSWSWQNSDGSSPLAWIPHSVPLGAPQPALETGGRRCFQVTTDPTSPIAIMSLFEYDRLSNRIAALRETISLLGRAYL